MKTETKSAPEIFAFNRATARHSCGSAVRPNQRSKIIPRLRDKNLQKLPFSKHFKGFQRKIFRATSLPSPTKSNQIQPYPPAMNAYPTKSEYIRPNPTNFFRMLETFHRYGFLKAPKGL
jgi:hypothetical protein